MAVPVGVDLTEPYVEPSYVDAVRACRRRPLLDCVTVRFEDVPAVRPFRRSRGERHFPGRHRAATTGRHVGFESWPERDRLVLRYFDPGGGGDRLAAVLVAPAMTASVSAATRACPDCFVRRTDGSAVVVDVRADERIEPRDTKAFEVTRLARRQAGWGFERVGVPEEVLPANVR
ncbi:TnsA-like heteromeric transposase endonuclease subunit [Streptomyces sp. NPDC059454]|uniref:TnsA-like heteromeric transposase endonuclease subunit n=1 Tax=Streptomyces sp. NPDC059454 TaxID=3346836 RepID=UPI0036CB37CE